MRHIVQLTLAAVAAAGAVLCWLQIISLVDVAPVTDGQPATISHVYNPPLMLVAWLLAVAAGVLAVVGVAGLLRRRADRRR